MGILSWVVWGLFVGGIARLLLPGRTHLGLGLTVIFGVAGSLLGGAVATKVLDVADSDQFDLTSFVVAIAGSLVLIGLFDRVNRALPDKRRETSP